MAAWHYYVAPHATVQAQAWAKVNGLRPSRAAWDKISRRLLGLPPGYGTPPTPADFNWLDHAAVFLDAAGGHVLTAQPYDPPATPKKVAELAAWIGSRGCVVEVSRPGWHNNGTVLLVVRRME
jgi:hypothetical protein